MKINFKQTSTEKRIRAVYLIAFVLLFVSYLTNLYANRQLVKQAQLVVHTNKVIKTLDDIIGKVRDGETGLRGYVISKKVEFLYPYFGAYEKADSLSYLLFDLLSDNPQQLTRYKTIKISVDRRFEILRYSLKAFNDSNRQITAAMQLLQPESIKVMDEIRTGISSMERDEEKLLKEREVTLNSTTTAISTITIISLILALSFLFFVFITYILLSK
jgi:CHASE3 domain sensor protein